MKTNKLKIAISISCSDKESHKIPSVRYFIKLIHSIVEKYDAEIVLFGSYNDESKIKNLNSGLKNHSKNDRISVKIIDGVIPTLKYLEESNFSLGISGTTGQGHMMAHLNIPLIIFYGVTNIHESGPYSSVVYGVRHKRSCGPCYQPGFQYGCQQHTCMDEIEIEDVLDGINKISTGLIKADTWYENIEFNSTNNIKKIIQIIKNN